MSGERELRYVWALCGDCRKKLEGLGYIITESERAPVWRSCTLCRRLELVTLADLYRPPVRYKKRSGAGERARAERRAK